MRKPQSAEPLSSARSATFVSEGMTVPTVSVAGDHFGLLHAVHWPVAPAGAMPTAATAGLRRSPHCWEKR